MKMLRLKTSETRRRYRLTNTDPVNFALQIDGGLELYGNGVQCEKKAQPVR
jgi:hypothetical protein